MKSLFSHGLYEDEGRLPPGSRRRWLEETDFAMDARTNIEIRLADPSRDGGLLVARTAAGQFDLAEIFKKTPACRRFEAEWPLSCRRHASGCRHIASDENVARPWPRELHYRPGPNDRRKPQKRDRESASGRGAVRARWRGLRGRGYVEAEVYRIGRCFDHEAEAAVGGPIALLQDGDIIGIDAGATSLNVNLTGAALTKRRTKWKARETNHRSGALWKYAQQVGPALGGAVTHPGGAHEKQCYADS